jgi:hypothetical protein
MAALPMAARDQEAGRPKANKAKRRFHFTSVRRAAVAAATSIPLCTRASSPLRRLGRSERVAGVAGLRVEAWDA